MTYSERERERERNYTRRKGQIVASCKFATPLESDYFLAFLAYRQGRINHLGAQYQRKAGALFSYA